MGNGKNSASGTDDYRYDKSGVIEFLSGRARAAIPILLLIVFVAVLLVQSGFFGKNPRVEVFPENRYEKTLTVITDEDYRPYSFYDGDGEFSGHDVELINIIANEMHMNLDLKFMNWYDGIDAITHGEADVLMTCDYSDTFAGVDRLIKCEPVSSDDFIVYSKSKISVSDDLYGKRIAVMKNGNVTAQINMLNLGQYCTEYENNRQAMQALIDGEADYAVMRQTVGTVLLQELGARGVDGYISIGQSFMCFGINADKPEIAEEIDRVIEKLKMNGEMGRLRNKWLTTFVRPYSLGEIMKNNLWLTVLFCVLAVMTAASMIAGDRRRRKSKEEKLRNAQVVEELAHDFVCVNYVELKDNPGTETVVNYRMSEKLKELIPGWENERFFRHKLELLRDNIVYEPDRQQFSEDVSREKVLEALRDSEVYFVNTRIAYDGEVKYYQMKFSPVSENGKIRAVVAGLHSVDEQTRNEMELQQQLEQALSMAQSANRAKTAFLNNMSHDIRTPMNAIIGYTELAEKHMDDDEKVRDYLGKIGQSSSHLLSLINDVLDMSRIESGKMNLEEKPENLTELVHALYDIVQADVQRKKHRFSVETADVTDENIICDRLRLNQVLLNILSNAIKYTPDGGEISMRVTEKAKKPSGYAAYEFVIKDNGIGMDGEYLKTIFDPFTRVKSSTVSGIQGTGLGMAITKNIIDMMGGSIDIESEPGRGTVMTVSFEFMPAGIAETADGNGMRAGSADNWTGKRVLLVEDNELNREIATEILEEDGFTVDTAEDGGIAVEKMRSAGPGDYDLVLMDVQMPTMNGYEATVKIRALGTEISKIPIIAMTANAFEEDRRAAFAAGMDEHIAKPIDIEKLKETLAKFL